MSPSATDRRARTRALAGLGLRALVLLGALAFLVGGVHWPDVTRALTRAGVVLPALVALLNAGMMGLRALRLRWLLHNKLSFMASFTALLTSSALNNVTPFRGGQVARLWMLERASGVSKPALLAINLVENLLELLVLAFIGFLASCRVTGQGWATATTPVLFAVSLGLLLVLRAKPWRTARVEAIGAGWRARLAHALRRFLTRVQPGLQPLCEPGLAARALALSLLAWLCEAVMILVCARGLAVAISFPSAILVLLGINLALALPSTPASAGPFEGATVAVLMLAGIAKEPALAFAFLYHALQVVPVTVAGLGVLLVRRRRAGQGAVAADRVSA